MSHLLFHSESDRHHRVAAAAVAADKDDYDHMDASLWRYPHLDIWKKPLRPALPAASQLKCRKTTSASNKQTNKQTISMIIITVRIILIINLWTDKSRSRFSPFYICVIKINQKWCIMSWWAFLTEVIIWNLWPCAAKMPKNTLTRSFILPKYYEYLKPNQTEQHHCT